jgi:hypothetical protein
MTPAEQEGNYAAGVPCGTLRDTMLTGSYHSYRVASTHPNLGNDNR